ncbi:MAG TPA: GGDEF domain-containing protein [Acidobacteriaceae bacterium]|jgi:diguanylate cyclase (GGDEF)-like protein|nr:GGDEF domain-containing protein [Acidobacteriaceae bacterium]
MYTPYLMIAYAAALLLVLVGFRVVHRNLPDLRGIVWLQAFVACGLCALGLFALRSRAPAFLTVVVANFLLFSDVICLYCAAAEILDLRRRQLPWLVGLSVAALPPFLWFTYGQPSVFGRLELHCIVLIVVYSVSASMLFWRGRASLRYPARACGWMMVAAVLVNVLWGLHGLIYPPNPSFLHPDAMDAGFSYLTMILGMSNVVGLAWLSFCVQRQELQAVAQTDSLTGLLNRGAFEEILRRELLRCASGDQKSGLGMMLIDIDFFKQVNDAHGHLVGDDVLRRVGATLRLGIRPSDVLARFGGEEFVILLRDAGLEAAAEVAERLRRDVASLENMPASVNLTASFGVAVSAPGELAGEFLVRADEALYRSKREGRNLVRVDRGESRLTAGLHVVRG